MRRFQVAICGLWPLLSISLGHTLPSNPSIVADDAESTKLIPTIQFPVRCHGCADGKDDELVLNLGLGSSAAGCSNDHVFVNGKNLEQVWDDRDGHGAGTLQGSLLNSFADSTVSARWESRCFSGASDGDVQVLNFVLEQPSEPEGKEPVGFVVSFRPGDEPEFLRARLGHGMNQLPSDDIQSWTNPPPEDRFGSIPPPNHFPLEDELRELHDMKQQLHALHHQFMEKKERVRKLLEQDNSTHDRQLKECDSLRCVWSNVLGKLPKVAYSVAQYFQRPFHDQDHHRSAAGWFHGGHPDGIQRHHSHPAPSEGSMSKEPHHRPPFLPEIDEFDDIFDDSTFSHPPPPASHPHGSPHLPDGLVPTGPEHPERPDHLFGPDGQFAHDEDLPMPRPDEDFPAPHPAHQDGHPPHSHGERRPEPAFMDHVTPPHADHPQPGPPLLDHVPPPSHADHPYPEPAFVNDLPPLPSDDVHPPPPPPHGKHDFPPPGDHPPPQSTGNPGHLPPPEHGPFRGHHSPNEAPPQPGPLAHHPGHISPPHHHPPHSKLFLPLAVLALLCTLLFAHLRRRIHDSRRRADRAFQREGRCTRRALRHAARRQRWSRWWSRYRNPTSQSDYDEKRALIMTQEDALEDAMQAELRDLQRAHQIVDGLVRTRQNRGQLANASTPAELEAGIASCSTDMGEAAEMPPPRYSEDLLRDEIQVVDGFLYTPSATDETPDSSVVDCSPRLSLDTSRTRASSNASKDEVNDQ